MQVFAGYHVPSCTLLAFDSLEAAGAETVRRVLRALAQMLWRVLISAAPGGQRTFHVLCNKNIVAARVAGLPADVRLHQAEPVPYAYQDNSEDCGVFTLFALLKMSRAIARAESQWCADPQLVADLVRTANLEICPGGDLWRKDLVHVLQAQYVDL